ncbi:type II toxin-antitoxin system death-on-curing family toxin [bacterium]|nr:type II toxin-antitoxin system death-on-curing family toxin [bacterium]
MAPQFLDFDALLYLHQQVLRLTPNEPAGILNIGALESAVNAPINLFHYEGNVSLARLAACYAYHISRNHAFMSANKRVAMAACVVFLRGNGLRFKLTDESFGVMLESTLRNEASFEDLVQFIQQNIESMF